MYACSFASLDNLYDCSFAFLDDLSVGFCMTAASASLKAAKTFSGIKSMVLVP